MLGKEMRLRKSGLFRQVCDEGDRFSNQAAVLFVKNFGTDSVRVGIAAGKRLGGAVLRNRLKRRFREAVRTIGVPLKKGTYMVIVARAGAKEMSSTELGRRLRSLLENAGVFQEGSIR